MTMKIFLHIVFRIKRHQPDYVFYKNRFTVSTTLSGTSNCGYFLQLTDKLSQ